MKEYSENHKKKSTNVIEEKIHDIDTKPIKCTICFNEEQDKITNIIKGEETNAWFCLKCGGLIRWF